MICVRIDARPYEATLPESGLPFVETQVECPSCGKPLRAKVEGQKRKFVPPLATPWFAFDAKCCECGEIVGTIELQDAEAGQIRQLEGDPILPIISEIEYADAWAWDERECEWSRDGDGESESWNVVLWQQPTIWVYCISGDYEQEMATTADDLLRVMKAMQKAATAFHAAFYEATR